MRDFLERLASLIFGLFLFAVGIVITIKANIGLAAWDLFHMSLVPYLHLSLGRITILVGVVITVLSLFFKEPIGLGTVLNMLLIGIFVDFLTDMTVAIPKSDSLIVGLLVMMLGLFVIAFASYFYLRAGFGSGPRDGLMRIIRRYTSLPIGIIRGIIEVSVVVIAILLGGPFGIGTVISALAISVCIQIVFSFMKFDVAEIEHDSLIQTWDEIVRLASRRRK